MNTQELKQYIDRVLGNNIRCLLPSYWWKKLFHSVADSIEKVSTSVNRLSKKLSDLDLDLDNYVDITRDNLFKLVQDEKLIPGRSYRITDYECTLKPGINAYAYKEEEFAIVVKALSDWELDQNAKATYKPGTWSGRSKYASWQLKYSIYNDVDKYPWARYGTLEYDAAVILDNPPYDSYKEMVVVWDPESNKYILDYDPYSSGGPYKGHYLITSETDKTPLAQTSFNYGDVVYVIVFGDVYSAKISYTKAMRDSGDAVLVGNLTPSVEYYETFKWNSEKGAYTHVLNDNNRLTDTTGTTIPKRSAFTTPEIVKQSGYSYSKYQTCGFNIPDGKGVIYYLKDSNNNEAYYDFKNIAFLFPEVSSNPVFTFDWANGDKSENWGLVENVKIENAGDLNYITFNVDPNINDGLNNVVVSSKIKNQAFNEGYKNVYIGYDDNNNLAAVNIFNIGEAREEIIIDSEFSYTSTNPVENKIITNEFDVLKELMFYMTSSGGYSLVTDTSSFEVDFGNNYIINTESAGDVVITKFNALELPSDNEYIFLTYIQKSTIMFKGATSLTLPEGVIWANGVQPDIDSSLEYELSIVRTIIADTITYKAVLTPFYLP